VKRAKYILGAVLVIALTAVAFQIYSSNSVANQALSSPSFGPGLAGIDYPNPIHQNVTLTGVMTGSVVSPACRLSSPPCAIADSPLYYITVNGQYYRLIFPNSTKAPLNHAHIEVTGVFVTPSTYQSSLWDPPIYFRGDIYVLSYYYVYPY
jgi:hypothetical protein